jgi:2-succinyl-6-hydroxy-2,4-cyclohexadiene-1-carboxylate synthase
MRRGGGGRVLVCLHGFLGSGRDWEEFAGEFIRLADGWSVRAPDLPGHGGGDVVDADRIGEWLGETVLADRPAMVVIAGYSMGGRLGLGAVLGHPSLCSGFVGLSTTAGLEDARQRVEREEADRLLARRLRGCDREAFADFLREWRGLPVFGGAGGDDGIERFVRDRLHRDPRAMAACLERWSPGRLASVWHKLPSCPLPMMFLAGGLDTAYSAHAARMAGAAPLGEVRILPGAGHRLPEVDPRGAAEAVVDWIGRLGFPSSAG